MIMALNEVKEIECVKSLSRVSLRPRGLSPARLLCPWNSPGKNTGMGCHAPPNPGIKPGSPVFQADSLLSEPPGKSSWQYSIVVKV